MSQLSNLAMRFLNCLGVTFLCLSALAAPENAFANTGDDCSIQCQYCGADNDCFYNCIESCCSLGCPPGDTDCQTQCTQQNFVCQSDDYCDPGTKDLCWYLKDIKFPRCSKNGDPDQSSPPQIIGNLCTVSDA